MLLWRVEVPSFFLLCSIKSLESIISMGNQRAKYDERSKFTFRMKIKFNIKYSNFKKCLQTHVRMYSFYTWWTHPTANILFLFYWKTCLISLTFFQNLPCKFKTILTELHHLSSIQEKIINKIWGVTLNSSFSHIFVSCLLVI